MPNPAAEVRRTLADAPRALVAEALGTAFLLACVVGSGIMAERLAGGNAALALLANALATGGILIALIPAFGSVSGAHFNPAVTLNLALEKAFPWARVPGYLAAQVSGAFAGTAAAHIMFGLPIFSASRHVRSGGAGMFSEFIATLGLLAVIKGCARWREPAVPFAVAGYIVAAYWFTSSTSFANPAVTLARAATDTFSGIRPVDVPGFLAAQTAAALAGTFLLRWLMPPPAESVPQAHAQAAARNP